MKFKIASKYADVERSDEDFSNMRWELQVHNSSDTFPLRIAGFNVVLSHREEVEDEVEDEDEDNGTSESGDDEIVEEETENNVPTYTFVEVPIENYMPIGVEDLIVPVGGTKVYEFNCNLKEKLVVWKVIGELNDERKTAQTDVDFNLLPS